MSRRIYISLLIFLMSIAAVGQNRSPKSPTDSVVFRGFSAHADVLSPVMGIATGKRIFTGEVQFDVNLLNKYFPIFEFGYADASHTATNSANYHAAAPFWRIGLNYNFLKTKKRETGIEKLNRHYPFIGLRYGMSVAQLDITDVPLVNDYWPIEQKNAYSQKNVYAGWIEILGGVRVDLAKGFTMGWSVRVKLALHTSLGNNDMLWYVPGFGRSDGTQFTFNYTIGFNYRTKFEKNRMKLAEM